MPAAEVHFHEVGALDAIADVVAVCAGFAHLGLRSLTVSPIALGGGTVRAAHGFLPVPGPAVVELLKGVPTYGGPVGKELTTPTGGGPPRHAGHRVGRPARPARDHPGLRRRRPQSPGPPQRDPPPARNPSQPLPQPRRQPVPGSRPPAGPLIAPPISPLVPPPTCPLVAPLVCPPACCPVTSAPTCR